MRGHRDLTRACAAAVACAVLSLLIPAEAISFVVLAPLAFFLTGYAILAAALPRWRAEPALRAAASLGVSLAVLALGALVLNYVGGLRPLPWALLLVVTVLGCARWAAINRPPASRERRASPPPRPRLLSVLAVALGLLAAGAGMALAFHPVSDARVVGFGELWIDTGASADHVRVGVGNQTHHLTAYGLIATFAGAETFEGHLELRPGQREVLAVPVRDRRASGPIRVRVTLYREGFPDQAYRQVSAWVPARGAAR